MCFSFLEYWNELHEEIPDDYHGCSFWEWEQQWAEEEMEEKAFKLWVKTQEDLLYRHHQLPTNDILVHHESPPSRPSSPPVFHFSATVKQRPNYLAGRPKKCGTRRENLKANQPQPPQRHLPFMPHSGEVRAKRKGKTQVRFRPVCQ